ncbi:MAG: fibronectin type III domain-containing protein, partial [Candidatus Hydrogenedentes bacterium]|nr:fibronectin type III domain-containing protein [Candidatus Hydrogenedentota bacterium]
AQTPDWDGKNVSAIATHIAPVGLYAIEPAPYNPPLPDAPDGYTRLRPNAADEGFVVDSQNGFDTASDPGWVWTNAGRVYILPFLIIESDGYSGTNYVRWQDGMTTIYGHGDLYLHYDSLPEFPGDYLILSGDFQIDLNTGSITPMTGASVMLDVVPLGVLDASSDKFHLSILGMGEFEGLTPRTGIAAGGASASTFGDLGAAEFEHLFLADLGGRFRITFGRMGYAGLLPPYVQGKLSFGDTIPLSLVFREDLFYADRLELPAPILEMLDGTGTMVYTMKPRGLTLTVDDITFDNLGTDTYFNELDLTIEGGSIGQGAHGVGIYADYAEIAYAYYEEPLHTNSFYAGTDVWRIDALQEYRFGDVLVQAQDLTLNIASADSCDTAWYTTGETVLTLHGSIPGAYEGIVSDLTVYHASEPTASSIMFTQQDTCVLTVTGSSPHAIEQETFRINAFSLDNGTVTLPLPGGVVTTAGVRFDMGVDIALWGSDWSFDDAGFDADGFSASSIYFDTVGENAANIRVALDSFVIDAGAVAYGGGSFNHYGYDWSIDANANVSDWSLDAKMTGVTDFDDLDAALEISGNNLNILTLVLPEYRRIVGGGIQVFALLDHSFESADSIGIHFDGDFQLFILPVTNFSDTDILFNDGEYTIAAGLVPAPKAALPPGMGNDFGTLEPPIHTMGDMVFIYEFSFVFSNSVSTALGTLNIASGGEIDTFFATAPYVLNALGELEFNGSLGYNRVAAGIYLFDEYSMADAQVIWGNVYVDDEYEGYGIWANGYLTLKKIVDGWATISNLRSKPDEGSYTSGVEVKGLLKVPVYVPVFGGSKFAGVTLRMYKEGNPDPLLPDSGTFEGILNVPLCVNYPYCKVKWCKKWGIPYPCGINCETRKSCVNFDIGFSFSPDGISVIREKNDFEQALEDVGIKLFTDGYGYYDEESGLAVMTNYRRLDTAKTLSKDGILSKSDPGQLVIPFDVPAGVPRAIVRYDYTPYIGDAEVSIRFPDGTLFTSASVRPLIVSGEETYEPVEGDWSIEYTETDELGETVDESLREAVYTFQGQWHYQQVELMEEPGVSTGEVVEELVPGYVMPGRYEIIIDYTDEANQGASEFLLENNPPKLTGGDLEQLDENSWNITWEVDDEDGDDVIVKLYLGKDPDASHLAVPIGDINGYLWTGERESLGFSFQDYSEYGFTEPQHLFISLDDGYAEHYTRMAILVPPNVPQPPDQVEGVVARAEQSGTDVFWDPVVYEPPSEEFGLGGYVIYVVERGADGATEMSRTLNTSLDTTELYVDELINGRIYEITVAAYAMRRNTAKAEGDPESYATYVGAKSSPVTVQPMATTPDKSGIMNPPRFTTSPPQVAIIGKLFEYEVGIEQLDGVPVLLSLENYDELYLPVDLDELVNNQRLAFVPDASLAGTHEVILRAQDLFGGESLQKFRIQVADVDLKGLTSLTNSLPPIRVYVGQPLDYQVDMNLPGLGGTLEFLFVQAPEGLYLDRSTGRISWTPILEDIGRHVVVVDVYLNVDMCDSCEGGLIASREFTVYVEENPVAAYLPVIAVTPALAYVGNDGGALDFEVDNIGTGTVAWTAAVTSGNDWVTL